MNRESEIVLKLLGHLGHDLSRIFAEIVNDAEYELQSKRADSAKMTRVASIQDAAKQGRVILQTIPYLYYDQLSINLILRPHSFRAVQDAIKSAIRSLKSGPNNKIILVPAIDSDSNDCQWHLDLNAFYYLVLNLVDFQDITNNIHISLEKNINDELQLLISCKMSQSRYSVFVDRMERHSRIEQDFVISRAIIKLLQGSLSYKYNNGGVSILVSFPSANQSDNEDL